MIRITDIEESITPDNAGDVMGRIKNTLENLDEMIVQLVDVYQTKHPLYSKKGVFQTVGDGVGRSWQKVRAIYYAKRTRSGGQKT